MKIQDGFKGQKSLTLPGPVIEEQKKDALTNNLFITDIGYYPDARFHYRERLQGCQQHILIYCTEGSGWVSIDGKTHQVKPHHFFILPPNKHHAYGTEDKKPWSIYWTHFSGQMADYFSDLSGPPRMLTPSGEARIDDRIQLFEEIFQNLEMGYSKENLAYSSICLWHFLASFKYIGQFRQIKKGREQDPIDNAIYFMRRNTAKALTLEQIAGELGLSPSHFSFIFRKKTGRSPMDYFIHLRIQKACQLLDLSTLRINEISQEVGYEDPYYFSRIFKRVMGKAPSEYRKQEKG